MIQYCILELIPFIVFYSLFLFQFSIYYVCLDMEIDPEVEEGAEGLSYFQKMILQTFRTSIGELGFPQYGKILMEQENNPSVFHSIQIAAIWLIWFVQTFFMLVILTNFIVAVVVGTYDIQK